MNRYVGCVAARVRHYYQGFGAVLSAITHPTNTYFYSKIKPDSYRPVEEVLDIYNFPYDTEYPVICFDENTKQKDNLK